MENETMPVLNARFVELLYLGTDESKLKCLTETEIKSTLHEMITYIDNENIISFLWFITYDAFKDCLHFKQNCTKKSINKKRKEKPDF